MVVGVGAGSEMLVIGTDERVRQHEAGPGKAMTVLSIKARSVVC